MRESSFWSAMRRKVSKYGHFTRIENLAEPGIFDVSYCVGGSEGWIELKVWPRKLRPTQVVWYELRRKAGAKRLWVLVKLDDIHLLAAGDYLRCSSKGQVLSHTLWNSRRQTIEELIKLLRSGV